MNATILKLLPLLLKLAPIILAVLTTRNWSLLQEQGGFDLIQAIIYLLLPGLGAAGAAGGALYVDAKQKQAALEAEPPVKITDTEDAVQVNAGGVRLSLRVDRTASGDDKFRSSVVEMVKSALAVRGGDA